MQVQVRITTNNEYKMEIKRSIVEEAGASRSLMAGDSLVDDGGYDADDGNDDAEEAEDTSGSDDVEEVLVRFVAGVTDSSGLMHRIRPPCHATKCSLLI